MKKKFGITQAMGECADFKWLYFGKNALVISAIHARKMRHKVNATHEVGGYFDCRKRV
jgi:hypothetical protein